MDTETSGFVTVMIDLWVMSRSVPWQVHNIKFNRANVQSCQIGIAGIVHCLPSDYRV